MHSRSGYNIDGQMKYHYCYTHTCTPFLVWSYAYSMGYTTMIILIVCAEKKLVTAALTVNGKAKSGDVSQVGVSVIGGDDRTEVCHYLSIFNKHDIVIHTLADIHSQSDMPQPFKKSKKEEKLHVDRIEVIVHVESTTHVYFTNPIMICMID